MHTYRPRPGPPRWLRPPRPTARLRLTILYGAAFLACGVAVLAVIAYLLDGHTTTHLPTTSRPATAELHGKFPAADVQQAGGYDIVRVPVKIPAADVQQVGGYDVLNAYRALAMPEGGLAVDVTFLPPAPVPRTAGLMRRC